MAPPAYNTDHQATLQLRSAYSGSRNKLADAARSTFSRACTQGSGLGNDDEARPEPSGTLSRSIAAYRKSVSDPCISRPYAPFTGSSPSGNAAVDLIDANFSCDDLRRLCYRKKPTRLNDEPDKPCSQADPDSPVDMQALDDLLFGKTPQGKQAGGDRRKRPPRAVSSTSQPRVVVNLAGPSEDAEPSADPFQQLPQLSPTMSIGSQDPRDSVVSEHSRASFRNRSFSGPVPKRKGGGLEDPAEAKVNRWKAQRKQWLLKDPDYMDDVINDLRRSKRRFRLAKAQLSETELWENAHLYTDYAVKVKRNSERYKQHEQTAKPSLSPPVARQWSKSSNGTGRQDTLKKEVRELQKEIRRSMESVQRGDTPDAARDLKACPSVVAFAGAMGNHFRALKAGAS